MSSLRTMTQSQWKKSSRTLVVNKLKRQQKPKRIVLRRSWEGCEAKRKALREAAFRCLDTDSALEQTCKKNNLDTFSLAVLGLSKKAIYEKNLSHPGAREAVDNANALLEAAKIHGELIGLHQFDSIFVSREFESIIEQHKSPILISG